MLRVLLLLSLLFAPTPAASEGRCPAGAEAIGFAPPDGDKWACVLRSADGEAIPHGWHVEYWANDNHKLAQEFEHGERHGRFSQWSEDGRIVARGRYEHGERVGYWWYWGVLEKGLYDPDGAVARAFAEDVLAKVGVAEDEVPALAEHLIEEHRAVHSDIRAAPQVCAPSACVSTATIGERTVLAVQLDPPADKVSATATGLADLVQDSESAHKAIAKERKRRERSFERAQKTHEKKLRSWNYTRLQCTDGTRSPSCICGGNWRGCCSHHGGVAGCPRDVPVSPSPDMSPLVPNELLAPSDE